MPQPHSSWYLFFSALGPIFVLCCAAALLQSRFALAWWLGLGIPFAMEARVQFGGRLPNSPLKFLHIALAVLLLAALSALALGYRSTASEAAAAFLLVATVAAAAPLWIRGVRSVMEARASR